MSQSTGKFDRIPVTKLDAARRQIDTAITLWFHDGDVVSIHTLTSAAHGIVHDLMDARGKSTVLFDPKWIRKERMIEWHTIVKKAQNFFKHADRPKDPTATLFFAHTATEFILMDALMAYRELSGESTDRMRVFWCYFSIQHPNCLDESTLKSFPFEQFHGVSKHQFFQECLPIAARGCVV